jgi:hypothetical protein
MLVQSLKMALSNQNNTLSQLELQQISSILFKLQGSSQIGGTTGKKSMGMTSNVDDLVYSMKSIVTKQQTNSKISQQHEDGQNFRFSNNQMDQTTPR